MNQMSSRPIRNCFSSFFSLFFWRITITKIYIVFWYQKADTISLIVRTEHYLILIVTYLLKLLSTSIKLDSNRLDWRLADKVHFFEQTLTHHSSCILIWPNHFLNSENNFLHFFQPEHTHCVCVCPERPGNSRLESVWLILSVYDVNRMY